MTDTEIKNMGEEINEKVFFYIYLLPLLLD
jgi:hypothetical protein